MFLPICEKIMKQSLLSIIYKDLLYQKYKKDRLPTKTLSIINVSTYDIWNYNIFVRFIPAFDHIVFSFKTDVMCFESLCQ